MQFLPNHQNLTVTPSPPTDPPPAPPPLNLPPSRARRQLAARLALHSQQKAESSQGSNDMSDAVDYDQSTSPNLSNNIDDDDDSGEDAPLQFGGPLPGLIKSVKEEPKSPVSPTVHRQLDLDDFANSPAADPEDRGSSEEEGLEGEEAHDVEMRIAIG